MQRAKVFLPNRQGIPAKRPIARLLGCLRAPNKLLSIEILSPEGERIVDIHQLRELRGVALQAIPLLKQRRLLEVRLRLQL